MSSEHNGSLIAELFLAQTGNKAIRILEEMDEIKDSSFVAAIAATYERFKNTEVGHYFLSSLLLYSSPLAKATLKKIALDPNTSSRHLIWIADSLVEMEINSEQIVERVIAYWESENAKGSVYDFEVTLMSKYLTFTGHAVRKEVLLIDTFLNRDVEKRVRMLALRYLLESNIDKHLQYFLDNYEQLRSSDSEHIFAEVLSRWKGTLVTKIEDKILRDGSERAKEIITTKRKKKEAEKVVSDAKKAESTATTFPNPDIIHEIYELRGTINTITLSDPHFGYALLPESGLLTNQMRGAQSESDLTFYCNSIRDFLQKFDSKIADHGFDFEQASKIIPQTTEEQMKSSLNQFQLLMTARKKPIEDKLFGLRPLTIVVNKLAHPINKPGLIEALREVGLLELYTNSEWQKLHRKILEMYRDSLSRIHRSLKS